MKAPLGSPDAAQPDMLRPQLRDVVAPAHPLVKLADAIDWPNRDVFVDDVTIVGYPQ